MPVLVEFWAPWCMPCKGMAPLIKSAGDKYKDRVEVWKINADQNPELLRSLGIRGIPTMLGYRQGEEVLRKTGAVTASALDGLFLALAEGREIPTGPAPLDRALRLAAALGLAAFGVSQGPNYWLLLLAAGVFFWAVHDRCPIYKALKPRVLKLFARGKE